MCVCGGGGCLMKRALWQLFLFISFPKTLLLLPELLSLPEHTLKAILPGYGRWECTSVTSSCSHYILRVGKFGNFTFQIGSRRLHLVWCLQSVYIEPHWFYVEQNLLCWRIHFLRDFQPLNSLNRIRPCSVNSFQNKTTTQESTIWKVLIPFFFDGDVCWNATLQRLKSVRQPWYSEVQTECFPRPPLKAETWLDLPSQQRKAKCSNGSPDWGQSAANKGSVATNQEDIQTFSQSDKGRN